MKTLRYVLATSLLTLTLSITPFAGEMTTGVAAPPPAPAEGGTSATVNGIIHTTNSDEATAGDAVVAEAALSLLQGVLALL